MSIECITGVPGSGKTYKAASIVKDAYDSKKRLVYTNVNIRVSYDDYLKLLDVDKLLSFAKLEYELFTHFEKLCNEYEKTHKNEDIISLKDDEKKDLLIVDDIEILDNDKQTKFNKNDVSNYIGNYDKYLNDSGILESIEGALIVWDECHNHLQGDGITPKANPYLIRFFSYHRHFKIDIVLVTQDISLIHRRYKPFISKFYFGQNPAKRFMTTTLKYKVYTDSREFEKFYIETQNIPMKKEIHDFYDSGEYNPSKSLLLKKILPAILLLVGGLIFFYFFFHSKKDENVPLTVKSVDSNISDHNIKTDSIQNNNNDTYTLDDSYHIIFFMCNLNNCNLKNSSFTIPLNDMKSFADSLSIEILYTNSITINYKMVAVSVSDNTYNDLMKFNLQKRGDLHENGRMDFRGNNKHI